jgi:hypothetical protein
MAEPTPKKTIRRKPRAKKIEITPEVIERRAYELWQTGAQGDHLAHWFQAERELVNA